MRSDGGFYCAGCPKLYAKHDSIQQKLPGGPTFDGSFGVDTQDLISVPSIDFGSLCVTSVMHIAVQY
jgi:mannan endo-1,4-beta-mannosidase